MKHCVVLLLLVLVVIMFNGERGDRPAARRAASAAGGGPGGRRGAQGRDRRVLGARRERDERLVQHQKRCFASNAMKSKATPAFYAVIACLMSVFLNRRLLESSRFDANTDEFLVIFL